jgi:hypothetical protein
MGLVEEDLKLSFTVRIHDDGSSGGLDQTAYEMLGWLNQVLVLGLALLRVTEYRLTWLVRWRFAPKKRVFCRGNRP